MECFKIVFEEVTPLLGAESSFSGALDSAWLCLCGALVMPLGCVLVVLVIQNYIVEYSNRSEAVRESPFVCYVCFANRCRWSVVLNTPASVSPCRPGVTCWQWRERERERLAA